MQNNDVLKELGTNFIEYAVAVNTDRAIPDAASGLKPVAKRILWSALEEGRVFSKPHVKSARIVGDVMGKYHPHGDSSIYGAMVRLSQPWVMRYPLIDWHGSNGNQMGDGPAAARYTEARLSKLAEDGLLQGLKKKNVDFILNYDETLEEPVTLPAVFPNLLCNPNTGIGVAMACNWLPHNLKEVAQAIYDYIDDKEVTLPGPDFPTGGIIINKNDIPTIMKTGHGSVKIRGQYKLEKNNIIFYEIPYGETVEEIMNQVGKICDAKEIEGINEIRDESNKEGLRIVIECDKKSNPDNIAQKLYSKTNLQTSISYNQVALIDKTPTELNLKQCIEIYINHNIDCLIKETNTNLAEAKDRAEVVAGLLKALEDINNIIALIRGSQDSTEAKEKLIKLGFSERQAKAILAMRLSSLTRLDKIELNKEAQSLSEQINYYVLLLKSKEEQIKIVRKRLETIVKKYGDDRRTQLMQIDFKEEKKTIEIIPEDVVVLLDKDSNIKRISSTSFKVQNRKGKGTKSDKNIVASIPTNTIDSLMVFTSLGRMFKIPVNDIPVGSEKGKGVNLFSLLSLENNEYVITMSSLYKNTNAEYIVFLTKNGMIKKSKIEEYKSLKRSGGIAAIKLKENDSVVYVTFLKDEDMFIISKKGQVIHIETKNINPIGRVTMGVKGITLRENDYVVTGLPLHKETDYLAIVTTCGYGKKMPLSEFPVQGRGGIGILGKKKVEKGKNDDPIAGAAMVDDNDVLLIIGQPNKIAIPVDQIPLLKRTSEGLKLIADSYVNVIGKI